VPDADDTDTTRWPTHVTLTEVGPRDGFQVERTPIPTDTKLAVIRGLVSAGLTDVQVASFVHPGRVPQMADAEALCAALFPAPAGVTFTGLVLNRRGVERALATALPVLDVSIACTDEQSRRNAGLSLEAARAEATHMITDAHAAGRQVRFSLQVAFGHHAPGDVPLATVAALAAEFAAQGVSSVALADSTGLADPRAIARAITAVRAVIGQVPLVLHLHDTRGTGLANVVEALRHGVTHFDTSVGGMGGCPFIDGATGNIATEDTAWLLHRLGVTTGIDLDAVSAVARELERLLGRRLDGKLHALPPMGAAAVPVTT
jgi:hydroxymethylglutaryl-CoA lyase